MKKLFFLVAFVFVLNTGFSQYNDTLYYNSGWVRAVTVTEYDKQYVFYEYRNKKGKLVTNRLDRSTLAYFVIYNEFNELIFNSKTGYKKEEESSEEVEETEE